MCEQKLIDLYYTITNNNHSLSYSTSLPDSANTNLDAIVTNNITIEMICQKQKSFLNSEAKSFLCLRCGELHVSHIDCLRLTRKGIQITILEICVSNKFGPDWPSNFFYHQAQKELVEICMKTFSAN